MYYTLLERNPVLIRIREGGGRLVRRRVSL